MKKLSFFLMAMLFSVMSFATDYSATNTSNVSFTLGSKAYDNKIKIEGTEYQAIKLGTASVVGDMSFTIPANTSKIHLHIAGWTGKSSAIAISASNDVVLGTTEITATSDAGMTGNSPFTLSDASKVTTDYYHVIELSSPTTAETTITMTSVSGKYRVVIWGVNTEEATSGEQGEIVDVPTFSATETNFTEAFNLTITSAEGTTLKYTTDKTDPTTSETAVVVESNTATVAISAKSTMVKAVAVKGELVSNVKSMTFCYVNSEATAYTVTEALAIYNEGLGLSNKLYIKGSVKSIEELNTEYGNATYTITDGDNDLYIYRGKNFGGEKFTSVDQLFVGDDLVLYGQLTSYNGNPQVASNNEIISRESKTKSIVAEDLTFEAIAKGAEVEAQTLTVIGANLTAEITATLDNEKFTVTPATLPAAGGDLTIAPAADLAVGEHTATLTLTSGETTKEVALSVLVKDVYAIEWYVNGEIYDETTVVEGDKLVLPAAPETPEACSEKVFVGWTAAEEVNADGSDIEWVTAATAPTAAATYYAVFAVQEGEGGLSEVVDVLDRALTGVEGTNYASWADVSATSDAVYAGQSAGGNEAIQLRSNNSNSGVISTTSGGKLAKVTVAWNSNSASGRTLNIYGSNSAYTAPTDLYGDASGEKLGTIVCGTSTELVIEGDYAYVGLRSNSGAMYLDEIQITWTSGAAVTYTDYSTTCVAPVVDFYVENVTLTEGQWSIDLAGSWNEQSFILKLWQDNTQGFGTYAANAETGYTATLGVKELTPTAEGYYMQDPMNENAFIFQGTMTDGTDIYEVFLKGALASSTGTGELEAKNEVYFTYEDGEWMIEAFADDYTWGLMLAVSAETDPETGENLVYGQYVTDIEAGINEEVAGTCLLYFDDFSGCYVFKGGLATASGNIYPTLYASSLTLMTNDLITGPSWVGEFAGVDYYEVLLTAADYSWELDLHARECTGANGTYTIDVVDEEEGAYSTFMGSTIVTGELTIEDGMYEANVTTVDSEGNPAMSISVSAWAAAAEEYDIVITNATVTDNTSGYNIDLTGEWEGHDIKVEVCDELTAETILANFFIDGGIANGGDQAEGEVTATVSEGVVTITGTFECLGSGNVYNVTISGTLPVAEPETITWELNGGKLPLVGPTNAELWEMFKPYYNTYYGLERADQPITAVASFASAKMQEIMTDPESEYKWLGDYVLSVAAEQGVTVDSELTWRFSVHTFFNAEKRTAYPSNVPDFTEAGKPENWVNVYPDAQEVVVPTEPVTEDYVLPTPVKEGCKFVGWYDNAEGIGEAMTVLPAGWFGTLYAIWKVEGPGTALENIAVEGKAVKAIINGQLVIIKNGVQYNTQGQVVK